jgi:Peptidase C39 family
MKRIPRESSLVDRFPALRTLEREPPQREIPFVQQLSVNECGAACLAMSLASFGKDVPLDEISELLGAGRDGSSALDLLRAARWYDLRGRGVKIELDTLRILEEGSNTPLGVFSFCCVRPAALQFCRDCRPCQRAATCFNGRVQPLIHRCSADTRVRQSSLHEVTQQQAADISRHPPYRSGS